MFITHMWDVPHDVPSKYVNKSDNILCILHGKLKEIHTLCNYLHQAIII